MAEQFEAQPQPASQMLRDWLTKGHKKTLGDLTATFAEKSFAVIFLLLMALAALPLPTGGVTHIFEIINMLVCLEMIAGRKTLWLPERWSKINISKIIAGKAVKKLIGVIEWFERRSRRRLSGLLVRRLVLSLIGVIVLIFTVAAFVAPPFSGLDTLPSLGVVTIALGLILEDALMVLAGIVIGCGGIALEIAAGTALYSGITHFF
jgi:hypothetical protein